MGFYLGGILLCKEPFVDISHFNNSYRRISLRVKNVQSCNERKTVHQTQIQELLMSVCDDLLYAAVLYKLSDVCDSYRITLWSSWNDMKTLLSLVQVSGVSCMITSVWLLSSLSIALMR